MICFSCGRDIEGGVVELSDISPSTLARWFRGREDGGLVLRGYACCIRCVDSTSSDALEEAVRSLKEHIEDLQNKLQRTPFYQAIVQDDLTPDAYGDSHAEELLARRTEIEKVQDELSGDPVFLNLLRDYHRDVLDLATFEARALRSVLQEQQKKEEG